MSLPNLYKYSAYRFGFNGMEHDKEINPNVTTAMYWEYDARTAHRWNVDPVVKEWQSSFTTFSNNPILNIDPNGDNDYQINKKGKLSLLNENKNTHHTIFNSDKKNKINVDLDFINKSKSGDKYSIYWSRNIEQTKEAFSFFAKNTDVEWNLSIFEDKSKVATLVSSHDEGTNTIQSLIIPEIFNQSKTIKLIFNSHSHPAQYDEESGYPAYPSGFYNDGSWNTNPKEQGDRLNYLYYYKYYKSRIPSKFNILVPSAPYLKIEYDYVLFERTKTIPLDKNKNSKSKKNLK